METIIIAAVSRNNVIGKDGQIPWHSKEELQHFKRTTMGYPIIMGRKTFESIGKPLKGRLNIIISRNKNFTYESELTAVFSSLNKALLHCRNINSKKAFIIGGGEIYREAIEFADTLLITKMNVNVEGDTFFPNIDENEWQIKSTDDLSEFSIIKYARI